MGRSKRSFDLLIAVMAARQGPELGRPPPPARPLGPRRRQPGPQPPHHHSRQPGDQRRGERRTAPDSAGGAGLTRASRHVVLNQCLCRHTEACHVYPRPRLPLPRGRGRPDQPRNWAAAWLRRRRSPTRGGRSNPGLVPMIVHAAYDAELLGIDYDRMLAVCFCCDCCCTVRKNLRGGPPEFGDSVLRCPACASRCGVNATVAAPVSTSVT